MKLPSRVASNPLSAALVTGALLAAEPALAIQSRYNMPPAVTAIAREIHWLHWFMILICGVIFVAVFGVMFYSIWAHRKSRGHKPADFHESTTVEIVWTIIPFLIVIGMAIPATKTVVAMKDTTNADLTIKATGYQWKWGYDYLKGEGEGISFLSQLATPRAQIDGNGGRSDREANKTYLIEVDNDLVVPVDKKVRIITTANDVIHAWMIPAFGVKQDAIPGFVRDTWFKAEKIGTYRGQCAELCGRDHAFMPIVVRVVSAADYTKWVGEKQKELAARADDPNKAWTVAELKERGAKVYAANCVACHQANGQGVKGAFPGLDGSAVVHDKAQQIAIMLNGKNAMPAWKQLSDVELAAAATYVRQSWSNKDEPIMPAEFKAARK
ncbi:MAG: cytochrome c oxidase subunit II [Variovorax sp.]